MKQHKFYLSVLLLLALKSPVIAAFQVTNYYGKPVRVEALDCEAYYKYKVFPSSQTWFSGNVANKARFSYNSNIDNGFYTIISGSSVPNKVCVNFTSNDSRLDGHANQEPLIISLINYEGCKVDINYNESGDGFIPYTNYDCFAKQIK